VITLAAGSSTAAWDQPGTLGFLVVFGMGVVLYFVFRSMTRHLRKVNDAARAAEEQPTETAAGDGDTVTTQDGTVSASAGDRSGRDRG
jgi:hypothetical protein